MLSFIPPGRIGRVSHLVKIRISTFCDFCRPKTCQKVGGFLSVFRSEKCMSRALLEKTPIFPGFAGLPGFWGVFRVFGGAPKTPYKNACTSAYLFFGGFYGVPQKIGVRKGGFWRCFRGVLGGRFGGGFGTPPKK